MSGPQPGFLATYNSLTDKHLVGYFSNARIRRHLQRSGLISRSGRIIPEKEYRLNTMRRDHQKYVQECLARAIFHKVLDMEHHHQLEIKRKLENSMRKERVQKIKVEHSRRSVGGASPMRSPHPPRGPRNHQGLHPLVAGAAARPFPTTSWRPRTAPGNPQPPLRLQPIHSGAAAASAPKPTSSKLKGQALEHGQQLASGGERSGLRLMNSVEYVTGISPYQLPLISNPVPPAPPPPLPKGDRGINAVRNGMLRGRRFRPTTAPNGLEQLLTKSSGGSPKALFRSNAFVTMVFLGKSVHLSHDDADYRDEIKVYQQHCGGENLCVYKGKLLEGETFQFVSKRHHGFPFSLTFFLNGIQVDRLSCCCEYKHQKRSRLGGRHGYFGFLSVEGAAPCYRCIIAMGLDKKPSPPKRKIEAQEENHEGSWRDGGHSEPSTSSVVQKPSKESVLVILPIHEVSVETVEDTVETGQEYRREERKKLSDRESEDSQEDNGKNEYDEDFEADEDANEEGQSGDQMNGMSKSISDDKNLNSDYEKESPNSSQNVLPASDSEKDERDGYSDSDSEDDKEGRRPACSLSPSSTRCSSEDESHAEMMTDSVKGKEEHNVQRASGNTSHAWDGNENGEEKLLGMEEIQETFALEKQGIDEAEQAKPEDLTAREDSGIFHENRVAIQHQSPEVSGELQQAGSAERNTGEDGEKNASTRRDDGVESLQVPLESNVTQVEDSSEEAPGRGGAPDGAFLAEGTRTLDEQKAAEQVGREGQMAGERQALEKEGFVAGGRDACSKEAGEEAAQAGDVLPREEAVPVLQAQGECAVEEPAPEERAVAEGDPQGDGTGKGMESGTAVAAEEQEVLMKARDSEAGLGELAPGGEELAGALGSREAGGAVSEGNEVAGEVSEGEEAAEETSEAEGSVGTRESLVEEVVGETLSGGEEAMEEGGSAGKGVVVGETVSKAEEAMEEGGSAGKGIVVGETVSKAEEAMEEGGSAGKGIVVGETVSKAEEAMEEGGSAGKGVVVGAVSGSEEAVEDANLTEGISGLVGPEEAVDEAISEGKDTVEKPGTLLEALRDMSACTGEALPEGECTVKPNGYSQLKASEEELMEMGKAAIGAATSEAGEASEVEGTSLLRAEDTVEESVEPVKGSVLQEAPGLEALVDAGADCLSEGSSQLEEAITVEKEGSARALLSGNPSLGSKAKTESAMEDGGGMSVSVETARAGSGGGEEVLGREAGPRELAAGMGELPEGAEESRRERPAAGELVGEGLGGEAPLPALWLSVSRAAEARAGVGGRAGRGALAKAGQPLEGKAVGQGVQEAGGDGVGAGAEAPERVTGTVWGARSGTAEGVAGGAAGEARGDRDEVARGQGVTPEAALGYEGRGSVGAEGQGRAGWAWGTTHPLSSSGAMSHGEQPIAETSSVPGAGGAEPRGRGSTEGEGLCPGTQLQPAAPGAVRDKDELQEGTEQVGDKAEGEQPGLCQNLGDRAAAGVLESARSSSGVRHQRKDSPVGGSPDAPGSAGLGQRSCGPREDVVKPDTIVMPPVQPQDGEETVF